MRRDWTSEGDGGPGLYIPVSHAGDNTVMMNHLDLDQAPGSRLQHLLLPTSQSAANSSVSKTTNKLTLDISPTN